MSTETITETIEGTTAPAKPPGGTKGTTGKGGSLERVTVNLTERSAQALEATAALTTETKTEVINKALQFYAYARQLLEEGGALYVREPDSSEKERLRLL
jgi:hypothetical protein